MKQLKKKVAFFEVEGGTDKTDIGFRKDTIPMVNSLWKRGWDAKVFFYSDEKRFEIFNEVAATCDAYVSRINPGNLADETLYHEMLRYLSGAGVKGMPHPDAMINYGAKDALSKLNDTPLVPDDTYAYYDIETFKSTFPKSLAVGERVLKQNRGSTGEGIWRVALVDTDKIVDGKVALDAQIKCTEAKDNHTEFHTLEGFMTFCEQYIVGTNGMLIDMTFLPRIKEGEIRVLMLHRTPVNVVHKKPAEGGDAFSATLFSGAKYRYDKPEEWPDLIGQLEGSLDMIMSKLGGFDLPLIWTADYILDYGPNGEDIYILGEMNCSCVGFTTDLYLSENVAEEIINILTKE